MNLQEELLTELVEEWGIEQMNDYLVHLRHRRNELDNWIKRVQNIRTKRMKNKSTKENGPRDGR